KSPRGEARALAPLLRRGPWHASPARQSARIVSRRLKLTAGASAALLVATTGLWLSRTGGDTSRSSVAGSAKPLSGRPRTPKPVAANSADATQSPPAARRDPQVALATAIEPRSTAAVEPLDEPKDRELLVSVEEPVAASTLRLSAGVRVRGPDGAR